MSSTTDTETAATPVTEVATPVTADPAQVTTDPQPVVEQAPPVVAVPTEIVAETPAPVVEPTAPVEAVVENPIVDVQKEPEHKSLFARILADAEGDVEKALSWIRAEFEKI